VLVEKAAEGERKAAAAVAAMEVRRRNPEA